MGEGSGRTIRAITDRFGNRAYCDAREYEQRRQQELEAMLVNNELDEANERAYGD